MRYRQKHIWFFLLLLIAPQLLCFNIPRSLKAFPPVVPARSIAFPLGNELPQLRTAFPMEISQKTCPALVSAYVLYPEIVDVFDGLRQMHVEAELRCAGIIVLPWPEKRRNGMAAI